jgi:DNA (cytosine-5)-methyltransferase 1
MGGLSVGFRQAGFDIRGFDHDKHAISTYRFNVGPCDDADLRSEIPRIEVDVLLGGPPCRPWSRLNLRTARREHPDRPLVGAFTKMVMRHEPAVFVLENVPLLERDPLYAELVERAARLGYDTGSRLVTYSDFGAASARKRLFLFGSRSFEVWRLLESLERLKRPGRNVGDALAPYEQYGAGEFADHEWPNLRTIHKYSGKYQSEKYGWYRLDAAKPAPSFGHVQKTYILHPRSYDGVGPRVISVREAMAIVGFEEGFRFPEGVPMTAKYRMVADAVSPVFSRALAQAVRELL